MAKKRAESDKQEEGIKVPIEWHVSDNIITRFVTNMTIQTIEKEFKISFFELKPGINLDPQSSPPKSVKADCVGSIIVTIDRLPAFIEVMQRQLDQYTSKS